MDFSLNNPKTRWMGTVSKVDLALTRPHLRAVIFKSYLFYLRKNHPEVNLEQLCASVGLSLEYLSDENNWVSVTFERRFMAEFKRLVPDPSVIRKVGQYGVVAEVMGKSLHFLCTHVLSLKVVYEKIPLVTSVLNKIISVSIKEVKGRKISYDVVPLLSDLSNTERDALYGGMSDFIENTVGYYSAVPTERGLEFSKVIAKASESGRRGEYIVEIEYPDETSAWTTIRKYAIGALLFVVSLVGGVIAGNSIPESLETAFLVFLCVVVWMQYRIIGDKEIYSREATDNLAQLDRQITDLNKVRSQLNLRYRETAAVTALVAHLSEIPDKGKMLSQACYSLSENLGYDRSVVLLNDPLKNSILFSVGHGLGDRSELFSKIQLPTAIESSDPTKLTNVFRFRNAILIKDVNEHVKSLEDDFSKQLLLLSGSRSFAAVPIASATKTHGILIADCVGSPRDLSEDDIRLLETVGTQIAIGIEKIEALDSLKVSLGETVKQAESYARFVPFEVLNAMGYKSVFDVKIGDGIFKNYSVLFSDIRDFSTLSEEMSPGDVLKFLNSYFDRISPVVKKHNGFIDKFIGDCVMAIFADPRDAIMAAVEIQRQLVHYNILRRFGGRAPIYAGVGVSYGDVIMGPLGFSGKMEITVLSDAVNVASRLDGLCKELNAKILVAGIDPQKLFDHDSELKVLDHGRQPLKGRKQQTQVFEILDPVLIDQFNGYDTTPEMLRFKENYINNIISKLQSLRKAG